MVSQRARVGLLETTRSDVPETSTRRWDDQPTARPTIPSQRGPQGPRTAPPAPFTRWVSEVPLAPVPAPPRVQVVEPVGPAAPAPRRLGLNPDLARVALCGLLLFGALVAQLSKPVADPDPAGPPVSSVQHSVQAPARR